MSLFGVGGSLILIAFGGVGIDVMHAELKRNKVQNTLDRAVLAAADLEQEVDPKAVMQDYFDKMLMPDALTSVKVTESLNYRRVEGTAYTSEKSNFTKLIGIDQMKADGVSTAEERVRKVEVSLVLDISGSMADNSRLTNMQSAANVFLDTVLTADNQDLVSINLVPYSEQVNAGPLLTEQMNVNWKHGYSHCLEFPSESFDTAALDTTMFYDQMQHFQWNYYGGNDLTDTVCPRYDYERINAWSQDLAGLKKQVLDLQPRAGTSIFLGMKWASALLHPSTRSINNAIINQKKGGDVAFLNRPAALDDVQTLKTIVLMTDGQHDSSYRLSSFAYDTASEVSHWAANNLWYYLERNVAVNKWPVFYWQKYNATMGDTLLHNVCEAAKDSGIVIWAIGFETTVEGNAAMKDCASSPAHYFDVDGTEIEDAFYSIARAINQLRLTQ
ncbi:pilus assembly protein TadG-related protein [Litorisediminicola beolgyonensis]|uniref:Pilus assembly protein TadG-related protein n=2 Tax=Litorisediminicola beolgyonensis TaxID=1173614 RepID=A0ABW3ZJG5_9RHOB